MFTSYQIFKANLHMSSKTLRNSFLMWICLSLPILSVASATLHTGSLSAQMPLNNLSYLRLKVSMVVMIFCVNGFHLLLRWYKCVRLGPQTSVEMLLEIFTLYQMFKANLHKSSKILRNSILSWIWLYFWILFTCISHLTYCIIAFANATWQLFLLKVSMVAM